MLRPMAGRDGEGTSQALAEQGHALFDLVNALVGGENKSGQAFPGILAQQAQAAAGADRGLHLGIRRESGQHAVQQQVHLQIVSQPLPVFLRPGRFGHDFLRVLLQAQPASGDHAFPRVILRLPAERLARAQRGGQIIVPDGEDMLLR